MELLKASVYDERVDGGGMLRACNETYLVKGISVSDAETLCVEKLTPSVDGTLEVKGVGRVNYASPILQEYETAEETLEVMKVSILEWETRDSSGNPVEKSKKKPANFLCLASSVRSAESLVKAYYVSVDETYGLKFVGVEILPVTGLLNCDELVMIQDRKGNFVAKTVPTGR